MIYIKCSKTPREVYYKYRRKIRGETPLSKGEKIITKIDYRQKTPAGQLMLDSKTLPNGNTQERIVTIYEGLAHGIVIHTSVYNPEGKLLKSYHGIRHAPVEYFDKNHNIIKKYHETAAYANTKEEIEQIVEKEKSLNSDLKYHYVPY